MGILAVQPVNISCGRCPRPAVLGVFRAIWVCSGYADCAVGRGLECGVRRPYQPRFRRHKKSVSFPEKGYEIRTHQFLHVFSKSLFPAG